MSCRSMSCRSMSCHLTNLHSTVYSQGDPIGQISIYWAIFLSWVAFFHSTCVYTFFKDWFGLHIGGFFHKLIWSLCPQLTDTKTVFFGLPNNHDRVVTFDWTTKTYNVEPGHLSGSRYASSCAVLR
jgi:hypothetical protein